MTLEKTVHNKENLVMATMNSPDPWSNENKLIQKELNHKNVILRAFYLENIGFENKLTDEKYLWRCKGYVSVGGDLSPWLP